MCVRVSSAVHCADCWSCHPPKLNLSVKPQMIEAQRRPGMDRKPRAKIPVLNILCVSWLYRCHILDCLYPIQFFFSNHIFSNRILSYLVSFYYVVSGVVRKAVLLTTPVRLWCVWHLKLFLLCSSSSSTSQDAEKQDAEVELLD